MVGMKILKDESILEGSERLPSANDSINTLLKAFLCSEKICHYKFAVTNDIKPFTIPKLIKDFKENDKIKNKIWHYDGKDGGWTLDINDKCK